MIQKNLVEIWFVTTILAAAIIFILRHKNKKKLVLSFQEALELAVGMFGGISGAYLIYQNYELKDQLYKLVGNEGRAAIVIGGIASVWFGFSQIKQLIDKP